MKHNTLISKARQYAAQAHAGQTRKFTGEPYFNHVESVAHIVSHRTQDADIIAAAYLHDTIEDCGVTHAELSRNFNPHVADLVQSLTNDEQAIEAMGKVAYMSEKLRHLPADALLIKLCDMLHNRSQTQSQRQANNYLAILARLAEHKPACWSSVHEGLHHNITAGGRIQPCPHCSSAWGLRSGAHTYRCGYCLHHFEELPLAVPPAIAEHITRIAYSVGGYGGPFYAFDINTASCHIEAGNIDPVIILPEIGASPVDVADWDAEKDAYVATFPLQAGEFRRFATQLYTRANPAAWKQEYRYDDVKDGTHWSLEFYTDDKQAPVQYNGSNAYPPSYTKLLSLIRPYFQRFRLPFEEIEQEEEED